MTELEDRVAEAYRNALAQRENPAAPVAAVHKVTLNIGSTDRHGNSLSPDVRAGCLDYVLRAMGELFGGASSYAGTGSWVAENGTLVVEPNDFVYSFTTTPWARDFALPLARRIAQQLDQEAVMVSIEPAVSIDFVTQED